MTVGLYLLTFDTHTAAVVRATSHDDSLRGHPEGTRSTRIGTVDNVDDLPAPPRVILASTHRVAHLAPSDFECAAIAAANAYGLDDRVLFGQHGVLTDPSCRYLPVPLVRRVVSFVLVDEVGLTAGQVARLFGMDRTTIQYAVSEARRTINVQPFAAAVSAARQAVRQRQRVNRPIVVDGVAAD